MLCRLSAAQAAGPLSDAAAVQSSGPTDGLHHGRRTAYHPAARGCEGQLRGCYCRFAAHPYGVRTAGQNRGQHISSASAGLALPRHRQLVGCCCYLWVQFVHVDARNMWECDILDDSCSYHCLTPSQVFKRILKVQHRKAYVRVRLHIMGPSLLATAIATVVAAAVVPSAEVDGGAQS